ncbi:MAG: hypothetical protein FWD12_10425, partial [Alphaproteobacteria bacterium]|nr:hypothetical protein [Alphaproteobacteria bacterium]
MGGRPCCYFTPSQNDIQAALDGLREHEFKAVYPAMVKGIGYLPDETSPAPGPQHASIAEATSRAIPRAR